MSNLPERADLEGRVALVTGAGRGVGRACAVALAHAGADVAALSRTEPELRATVQEVITLGRRALALPCDVTDSRQVAEAVGRVRRELGAPLVLVVAAGIAQSAKLLDIDDEAWERHLRVNVTGAFYAARAVLPGMLDAGWGRIIMIASVASRVPAPYTAAYTASKHALLGLTRALALEFAQRGITANAICPGYLDTAMTDASIARIVEKTGRAAPDVRRLLERASPQGRLFTADEVAAMAVFLCTDAARGINGQGIVLDGGGVMA